MSFAPVMRNIVSWLSCSTRCFKSLKAWLIFQNPSCRYVALLSNIWVRAESYRFSPYKKPLIPGSFFLRTVEDLYRCNLASPCQNFDIKTFPTYIYFQTLPLKLHANPSSHLQMISLLNSNPVDYLSIHNTFLYDTRHVFGLNWL